MTKSEIKLDLTDVSVAANLAQVEAPLGLVILVPDIGSSHSSPRYNFVADVLNQNHITTVVADLLAPGENSIRENTPDVGLLTDRLIRLTEKVLEQFAFDELPMGYFGAGTGVASALDAADFLGERIKAIVSFGGRLDLAKKLNKVQAPTLLIVGSNDTESIDLNKRAYGQMTCDRKIEIVSGASRLFGEPGTLNEVANLSAAWYELYLWSHSLNELTH